ncbi:MAG: hypothetical protein V4682_00835 [Patescibacteria group bacterium]
MGRAVLSEVAYRGVADTARAAGSATHRGEQRHREGKGLDPLVDPSGFGVIRRSLSWYEPRGDKFELLRGVAMLEETRLDTTGSMGRNVEIAMKVLPTTYELLATGANPVLGRYDTQMITSIFGDVCDHYVLNRSQAELDERIAEQMTLMVPEGGGGDNPEDPQYGIFGGAFLTQTTISAYDLKHYDFTISDAPGRHIIDPDTLIRVFGKDVFDRLVENGHQINKKNIPDLKETVQALLTRAHAFFLQVGGESNANRFWTSVYGPDRVIVIPRTELLPQVKAAIIGLTEGVLDLQSVEDYLQTAGLESADAKSIARSVSKIPVGAQAELPNFDKIPLRGALFENKGDLWPIAANAADEPGDGELADAVEPAKDGMWA